MREGKQRDRVDNETPSDQQLRRDHVTDLRERISVGNREEEIQKSERAVDKHKDTIGFREENAEFALGIAWITRPYHRNSTIAENFILFIVFTTQLDTRPTRSLHGETFVTTGRPVRYIFTMIEIEENNGHRELDSMGSGLHTIDAKGR